MTKKASTSWQSIGKWYDQAVGASGHYYHQAIIFPRLLKLLDFSSHKTAALLDIACGQGVLERQVPASVSYCGVDIAPYLIASAKRHAAKSSSQFITADVTKPLSLPLETFSHASLILALQNIENPLALFHNVFCHLKKEGLFLIVLNHPCFRIPRQSSWGVDEQNKMQYRRIDRYMSPMKIPIQAHPSQGKASTESLSFHYPLSDISRWLYSSGFSIDLIEEWCSDKVSEGKNAKMENRSRAEIPLFMAILARKNMMPK